MYKVKNKFNEAEVGDIIELNERRAKSELRHGNVVEYVKKAVKKKPVKKTKEQKFRK